MTKYGTEPRQRRTVADLMERLTRFEGQPEEFLQNLLVLQCRLAGAEGGAILRPGTDGRIEVVAVYPPVSGADAVPAWLAQVVELAPQVLSEAKTLVRPLTAPHAPHGHGAAQHLVSIPLRAADHVRGVSAFVLTASGPSEIDSRCDMLEPTVGFLALYETRLALRREHASVQRLQVAMDTVTSVDEHDRFLSAAMSFCNEVASRWHCERVSLGFLKGRQVHVRAMSHTEKLSRKMRLVQDIESVMEECLDQDMEITYPANDAAVYVCRAAAAFTARHGPNALCAMPLRQRGTVFAVLLVERSPDQPLTLGEIEVLRLTCDVCASRLSGLHEQDRWFGAKWAIAVRRLLAGVVGPKHTWAKLTAILVLAGILFLTFAKGEYRAEAPFVLEATKQQIVVAPFDGYLKTVPIRIGDPVDADTTILATLETAEIELELAAAKAELAAYLKQESVAQRDSKTAEAQMARAQADKIAAEIDLLIYQLEQAMLTSGITGVVVTGDLQRQLGAPVKTGDLLFEVAQLGSIRAKLFLPEDLITDVIVDQQGELATASYPSQKIPFAVERINPVAEVVNQRNVFEIRARLLETHTWMRPGMEGIAKISVGRRSYGWIWSRRPVNWIRMKLWL